MKMINILNEYKDKVEQPQYEVFLYLLIPFAVIALFIIYKLVKKRKMDDFDE